MPRIVCVNTKQRRRSATRAESLVGSISGEEWIAGGRVVDGVASRDKRPAGSPERGAG